MFGRLRKSDAFGSTTAVFPNIDVDRIAAELRLKKEGVRRGQKNLPKPDEAGFDLLEGKIVERVEELRRKGLEHFEDNVRVYEERIARASGTPADIITATGTAETDFRAEINIWNRILANERSDLRFAGEDFEHFRRENDIARTAHEGGGLLQWFGVSLIILLVESVMNGGFFANAHELGLAGGILTAIVISIVNISVAAIVAWTSRNFNHRKLGRRFIGALAFLCGVAFVPLFNLFVAHFRNAAEAGKPWGEAAGHAIQNIHINPLGLESIDAWILGMIGMLAAALAGWKTYASGDPYPGYGRVWRKMREAREAYAQRNEDAINAVTETRDKAVDDLKLAISNMEAQISEAVSASRGLASLRGQLGPFLEQCDLKVNLLLTTYRNANQEKRTTPSPEHFSRDFHFNPFAIKQSPADQIPLNTKAIEQLKEDINQAIARIFDACMEAIESFKSFDNIKSNGSAVHALQSDGETSTEAGSGNAAPDHIASFPGDGAKA